MANITTGTVQYKDRKGRSSGTTFTGARIDSGNITAQLALFATLQLRTNEITLGARSANSLNLFNNTFAVTLPTDANALIERKWLVTHQDVTEFYDAPTNTMSNNGYGKKFNLEIPIADVTAGLKAESDEADLTTTAWSDWVAAFEAYQRSPYGGAVEVLKVEIVGR